MMFESKSDSALSLVNGLGVSFIVGTLAYWGYFHRVETHMYSVSYLTSFLLTGVAIAVSGVKLYNLSQYEAIFGTIALANSFLLGAFGNCLIWRLFFNPLNKFPGPWWARVSSLWLTFQMGNSDGYYKLQDLHKKYGKYVRVGSNDLSITDPEIMEMAHGQKAKTKKAPWYDGDAPLTSMHTSRDKALHDRRRRVWAPAFSEKAVRDYETVISRLNEQFIGKMEELDGKPANLTKWFNLYSFDAMGLLAFGKQYDLLAKGEKPMELKMLDEGMQPLAYRLPTWLFRTLVAIPGAGAGYKKFVNFCISELAWRVHHDGEKEGNSDILSWLLKAYKEVKNPEKDVMLQADSRLIIVAGSDTTAATLTFMFYHIAQDPNVVKKLRKELEPLTEGAWQETDIRGADYLNGCINEALRMHPPVPSGVFRLTPPEGLQVGKTYVPGDAMFFNPMYVMGRDPDIYVEPDKFIPERWFSNPEKIKNKNAFAPFSVGPYGCIGKNLALMELRTLTTRLVKQFDIKLAPNEDGNRLMTKTKDHFTLDLGDLEVILTPRE